MSNLFPIQIQIFWRYFGDSIEKKLRKTISKWKRDWWKTYWQWTTCENASNDGNEAFENDFYVKKAAIRLIRQLD